MIVKARWRDGYSFVRPYYVGDLRVMTLYRHKRGYSTEPCIGPRGNKQHKTLDMALACIQEETNSTIALISPEIVVEHDPIDPVFSEVDR